MKSNSKIYIYLPEIIFRSKGELFEVKKIFLRYDLIPYRIIAHVKCKDVILLKLRPKSLKIIIQSKRELFKDKRKSVKVSIESNIVPRRKYHTNVIFLYPAIDYKYENFIVTPLLIGCLMKPTPRT